MSVRNIEKAISVLEVSDKSFCRDRIFFFALAATRLLLSGIEMTIMLPSLWLYIEPMGGSPVFMGFVESSYGIGAIVSLPLVGLFYDRFKKGSEIIIFLNFLQISGNVIYAVPVSKWFPFWGRFISGLGDSFMTCYLGELSYTVVSKRRTAILSLVTAGRLLGITFGPLLNFFIIKVKFHVGWWCIDKRNFPGILMAMLWTLLQVFSILLLQNSSSKVLDYVKERKASPDSPISSDLETKERDLAHLFQKHSELSKDEPQSGTKSGSLHDGRSLPKSALDVLVSLEFLALIFLEFFMWTSQQIFRIFLPLITEREYHFTQEYVGIFYIAGGGETVLIVLLMYLLSSRFPVRDTYLVAIAFSFMTCAQLFYIFEFNVKALASRLTLLCLAVVSTSVYAPLCYVASKALISRSVPAQNQGAVQGCYLSAVRMASIIGPLAAGYAYRNRTFSGIVMISFTLTSFAFFACTMKRFHRRQAALEHD